MRLRSWGTLSSLAGFVLMLTEDSADNVAHTPHAVELSLSLAARMHQIESALGPGASKEHLSVCKFRLLCLVFMNSVLCLPAQVRDTWGSRPENAPAPAIDPLVVHPTHREEFFVGLRDELCSRFAGALSAEEQTLQPIYVQGLYDISVVAERIGVLLGLDLAADNTTPVVCVSSALFISLLSLSHRDPAVMRIGFSARVHRHGRVRCGWTISRACEW
jgi:hypothetical protein